MIHTGTFWSVTDGTAPPPPTTILEPTYVGSGLASGIGFRSKKREFLWWGFSYLKNLKEKIYASLTPSYYSR